MAFQYQSRQQQKYAEELAKADAPMNQETTLRGPQNTEPLYLGESLEAYKNVPTKPRYKPDPKARGLEGFFDFVDYQLTGKQPRRGPANLPPDYAAKEQKAGREANEFRPGAGFTQMVTPPERARESEVQRMAQQYGGNEMRLALMDQAPTDQRLVDYYGAQARSGQALGDQMGEYFANTKRFGGDRALADKFVQQHAGVAFREYIKENPQAVVGDGQKAAFSAIQPDAIQDTMDDYGLSRKQAIQQIQQGGPQETEVAEPEGGRIRNIIDPSGIDPSVNFDQPRTNREMTQQLAYKGAVPYDIAHVAQTMKTEVPNNAGQPMSINAEKPVMAASPFTKANKQTFDLLGVESSFGEDMLGEDQTKRLLQRLDSIKRSGSFLVD